MKVFLKIAIGLFSSGLLFVVVTNVWVISSTSDQIFAMENIPENKVGLVLGTSKMTSQGLPNRFFKERMQAAAELYSNKKLLHILVSGDNRTKYYNEPRDMLQALGDLNIPEEDVSLDFAGFRTLDSVVRSKEVFGQDSLTIITQKFHCYRALFIANKFGIQAIAFSADNNESIGVSLGIREILARAFAVADIYILRRRPKFLGEKLELNIREPVDE